MKKSINNTKRSKGGFNIIDLFLTLVIAVLVGAALYAYLPGLLGNSSKDGDIEYTVVFDMCTEADFASVQSGDSVLCDKLDFGTVRSVTSEPAYTYVFSSDDCSIKQYYNENKYRVTVVISASASVSESAFEINGRRIAAGLDFDLSFPTFSGSCHCISAVRGE